MGVTEVVKEANTSYLTEITLFTNSVRILVEKGVRQGGPLSSVPFEMNGEIYLANYKVPHSRGTFEKGEKSA